MSLSENLHSYFGFSSFREGQEEIIRAIIDRKNVVAILPTGAGKSLCYQLPALLSSKFSIVISPLIALMKDQVDNLNRNQMQAGFINSTLDFREAEHIFAKIAEGSVKLLYVAPERLTNIPFADRIKSLEPDYLFVDEAHCISEWGHNFRPSYRKIKEFIDYTGIKHIAAFTATATPEVVHDITVQMGMRSPEIFVRGFERKNLSLHIETEKHKRGKLLEVMRRYDTPAIIYTSSRKMTEEIHEFLSLNGFKTRYYHAGQDSVIRRHVQDEFISGKVPIIVATNAFGMGIDKKDIRLVVHYNMPGSIENYYQEIGRAGRDGKPAHAVLLYDSQDENIHKFFIATSHPQQDFIKSLYDAICDFGNVALGDYSANEILLNYEYLRAVLKRQDITRALVHAGLRVLEDAGHLRLISELSKKVTMRFIVSSQTLKNYIKTTHDHYKKLVLLQILRFYGGSAFDERTYISIGELASALDATELDLDNTLQSLAESGILEYNKPSVGNDAVTLISPRIAAARLNIDYRKINETYLNAHKKLQDMVQLVFAPGCRFKFILHYFGQKTENYRCGMCDNCQSATRSTDDSADYIAEMLLQLLYTNKEGLKLMNCITILRGTSSSASYKSNPLYAMLKHFAPPEISRVAESLLNRALIKYDFQKKQKLLITNSGISLLTEKGIIQPEPEHINYEENLELYHLLKKAREKAAARFNQSAFLICPDDVLREVIQLKPDTHKALMAIPGFNERMYNKIGKDFLVIIEGFSLEKSIPESERTVKKPELESQVQPIFKLIKEGYSLSDIASLVHSTEAIVAMQIETILEFDSSVDVNNLIPVSLIKLLEPKVKKGVKEIKELKKNLGDDYTYPQIRIAAAKIRASL
ncbi:MAG: RecQ family ATP-dependent DNA helicase [Ignavibacteria bacterium]|nr:RecQ family ATP-dependent DNA helicase [Ignavibacteria bacterium]